MNKCKTIAVLFHESATPKQMRNYRAWHLAQVWKDWGIDVQLLRGANDSIDADLVIPQIDLSVRPRAYRFLQDSKGVVLNRNVLDIRKTSFSRNLVSMQDEYDGPVIVKTNANSGGAPENLVFRALPPIRRKIFLARRLLIQFVRTGSIDRLAYVRTLNSNKYPVYPSKREVPRGVFKNPNLVIEKFLPEKNGDFYYSRSYVFLGNEGVAVRIKSECPVVKNTVLPDLEFVPIDETMVAAREALGFDYGKFDYVVHNGEPVLLDINATPYLGTSYSPEVKQRIVAQLAKGIATWFSDSYE
ncbi:MAG: hypothetical protein SWH78_16500 [Thermodesulfobacteriota bacterium]|nr:hypothetical protein [Thermodesulfobacteriota bacterium]